MKRKDRQSARRFNEADGNNTEVVAVAPKAAVERSSTGAQDAPQQRATGGYVDFFSNKVFRGDLMFNILVADDQPNIRRLYEYTLEKNGYRPFTAANGKEVLAVLESEHIDLVILDVMMPTLDGYGCLKTIRENGSNIPVLIITAKDSAEDLRRSFMLGTDDYMVKPVDEIEMLLRIKALLRRAKISEEQRITVGGTDLVYDSFSVIKNGTATVLPRKEFQILFKLLSFPEKTFTRQNLMNEFWAMDSDSEARTVDVHINRLRERFRDNEDFEIVTVRGLGYKAVKKSGARPSQEKNEQEQ